MTALSMPLPALPHMLPRPGPVWGAYPLRAVLHGAPPRRLAMRGSPFDLATPPLARARGIARDAEAQAVAWRDLGADARALQLAALRRRLRRDGLVPALIAQALGVVAACADERLALGPRPTQLVAAAVLLDQRLAEMATGEGKTLALALAAAVAALAGVPVHVVTANAYLASRDAAFLQPLYAALGLSVAALPGANDADARRAAYAQDVVYATARELAFDFLRDRVAMGTRRPAERVAAALCGPPPARPLMRGLCMAILDEADSILLDEADVPLILSRHAPHAARRAFLWQALALARQLEPERDFTVDHDARSAALTPAGEARIDALAAPLGGPWQRPRYRREAIVVALAGLHACRRDAHYVVRDGAIELLDDVTGRIADGRVWSRGLHTVVALKEGLAPPSETDTVQQITFQRFFQQYLRIAGLSGTLREGARELHAVLGCGVVRIPLHAPSRLRTLAPRVFGSAGARLAAVCTRAAELQTSGRPVLIGTDSVADSQALSHGLRAAGIEHAVLNALHDADEAAIVAAAGRAGRVTVATRMAGRGTDIALDEAARQAGGLHVLSCQANPSRRLDRQLAGRAARHGDPGSTEAWFLARFSGSVPSATADSLPPWTLLTTVASSRAGSGLVARAIGVFRRMQQRREERRRAALRDQLLRQDRQWERRLPFG